MTECEQMLVVSDVLESFEKLVMSLLNMKH